MSLVRAQLGEPQRVAFIATLFLLSKIIYDICDCGVRLIIKAFVPERQDMDENITDKQFDVLMNSIIQIVKDSATKEEAVEKLQNLIDKK